jgi:hypothetical protein
MEYLQSEQGLASFTPLERSLLRAAISTAWTLWLRIEELFSLR